MEVVLAMAVLSIAMGPILSFFYYFSSSSATANHKMAMTVIAEDTLSEIVNQDFREPGTAFYFGPEDGEDNRLDYDDIDDYCGYISGDYPVNILGQELEDYGDYQVSVAVDLTYLTDAAGATTEIGAATDLPAPYIVERELSMEDSDGRNTPYSMVVSGYGDKIYVSLSSIPAGKTTGRVLSVHRTGRDDHEVGRETLMTAGVPKGLALSPLNDELYVAVSGVSVEVFKLEEILLGGTAVGKEGDPLRVACVSTSDKKIFAYVTNKDSTEISQLDLMQWPPDTGEAVTINGVPDDIVAAPDGDRLFVGMNNDHIACIYPTGTTGEITNLTFVHPVRMAVDAASETLFVAEADKLTALDIAVDSMDKITSALAELSIDFSTVPAAVALAPDGCCLVVSEGKNLHFIDVSAVRGGGDMLSKRESTDWKIELDTTITALAFSPSGDRLYATDSGKKLYILKEARKSQTVTVTVRDRTKQCRNVTLSTTVYR